MPGQGNIILIAVTIVHDYHGHCSANTLKNVSFIKKKKNNNKERKNPKGLAGYGRFMVKTKKKSKGLLNVEFTPRFLALRNTSMRLQKYTPSSKRFPSHFSLISLRVVFTLISDKTKKQRTLASDCIFETGSLSFIRYQPSYGNLAGSIK